MKTRLVTVSGLLLFLTVTAFAQNPRGKAPIAIEQGSDVIRHIQRGNRSGLPPEVHAAVQSFRVRTIPYWTYGFAYQGTQYSEFAVGKSIFSNGGTAVVNVPVIPVKFRFPAYADPSTGQPVELDGTSDVSNVLLSPNFSSSQYSTGYTQYQDAAQRASFYGYYPDTWHTMLVPRVLKTVTIDVPADKGIVYFLIATGTLFAEIDEGWFYRQQQLVNGANHIPVEQLPVLLTHNISLYSNGDPDSGCCVFAWHGSYVSQVLGDTYFVQTYIWGGWYTPDLLGPDQADVKSLSHEVAEWMNDPFTGNVVPHWDYPQGPNFYYPAGFCESDIRDTSLLEVADPLQEYFFSYQINLNGFTYHVANQVLASWFSRDAPSSGIHGAYSFPDETLQTGPSPACP